MCSANIIRGEEGNIILATFSLSGRQRIKRAASTLSVCVGGRPPSEGLSFGLSATNTKAALSQFFPLFGFRNECRRRVPGCVSFSLSASRITCIIRLAATAVQWGLVAIYYMDCLAGCRANYSMACLRVILWPGRACYMPPSLLLPPSFRQIACTLALLSQCPHGIRNFPLLLILILTVS